MVRNPFISLDSVLILWSSRKSNHQLIIRVYPFLPKFDTSTLFAVFLELTDHLFSMSLGFWIKATDFFYSISLSVPHTTFVCGLSTMKIWACILLYIVSQVLLALRHWSKNKKQKTKQTKKWLMDSLFTQSTHSQLEVILSPQETFNNIWKHFWCHNLGSATDIYVDVVKCLSLM